MIVCPACKHENSSSQNYCGNCGTRLAGLQPSGQEDSGAPSYTPPHLARDVLTSRFALEGERKLVTVLFCDIANSTPLAARIGAEAMHGLLSRFFDLALGEVHRYEGTINQFLGDGFMALFGAPLAHEDHARRAVLAATAIEQQAREANGQFQVLSELRLRMGLNTGTVVVGKIGDNLRMDYTAIGDTTNIAARLQSFAKSGTIRVSEATRRAAAAHFEFTDLGKHWLKGISDPVAVFEPRGARSRHHADALPRAGGVGSVLVGRDQELKILTRSLEELAAGKGSIVVVRGEPGAGKSRLLAEARKSDAAQGVTWLEGRAVSFGRSLSYLPFIEILKGAFGILETDSEATALAKLEAGVTRLFEARAAEIVPYLATVMALELKGEMNQRVAFLDAQAMKRQVFLTARQMLERVAASAPVLIVLEDWHWVDQSSIMLLEHLLPLARSRPIAFWAASRTEPAEPIARVRAAAGQAGISCHEIAVGRLTTADGRTLIENLIGAKGLPELLRTLIERRTEGNPFFIEEVIRALIADGTLVRGDSEWRLARPVTDLAIPDTVQGVIVARIDRLEEGVKGVLKLASVIGRSFFLRIVKAISETADDVEDRLDRLETAELVRQTSQLPELEYIFKHALVQEAAYGSILAERRRVIHRSVGQAIESLFPERIDEFASLLAHHYALAEDWEKAQAWLFKAGDQAGRMAADAEALEHYQRAEAAFMRVAGSSITPLQRATMDRKLGQAFFGIGDYYQAVAHFTRALAHLGIQYPSTRWGVRRSIAMYLWAHVRRRIMHRSASSIRPKVDKAVAQEISRLCQSLAWLDYLANEERFALDSLIELYAGERGEEATARARGLSTLGLALLSLRARGMAGHCIAEAAEVARDSGNMATTATAELAAGILAYGKGALADCTNMFERSAAAYRAVGDIRGWGGPTAYLCWTASDRAQLSRLATHARELVHVGEDAADPHVTSWGLVGLGQYELMAGSIVVAIGHLLRAQETSARISSYRMQAAVAALLGRCFLRQGRLAEATAAFDDHMTLIKDKGLNSLSANPFVEYCIALVENDRSDRQVTLRQATRACRLAHRNSRSVAAWLADTQRLHGTIAWLSGDAGAARTHWHASSRDCAAARNATCVRTHTGRNGRTSC